MDTLAEVLDRLSTAGYVLSFEATAAGFSCDGTGQVVPVDQMQVDEIVRIEGDSDPDDELIVFALTCGACGCRGTFVSKFGPDSSEDEATLIRALAARHA